MPKNLNRLEIIGRLGDFPEMRYSASGLAITRISLGVSNDRFNKETEEWDERTDWIPVTFFGFKAENIAERMDKGDLLYVECRVSNNKFEKEGVTVYTFNFVGDSYERVAQGNHTRDEVEDDDEEEEQDDLFDEEEEEEEEVKPKPKPRKSRRKTPKKKVVVEEEEEDDDDPPW